MSGWGKRAVSLGVLLCASTALATVARAQSFTGVSPPPVFQPIDANGVDVTRGTISYAEPALSIGAADSLLSRQVYGAVDSYVGVINSSGSNYTVTLGGSSTSFTLGSSGAYTNAVGGGATLTSGYVYTAADGTVAYFNNLVANAPFVANVGLVGTVIRPNGETLTYYYAQNLYQAKGMPYAVPGVRITSIVSSSGWMLKYNYLAAANPTTSGADFTTWLTLQSVTAINTAVEPNYCNPNAAACTTSLSWPSITYSGGSASLPYQMTDSLSRTTSVPNAGAFTLPSRLTETWTVDSSNRVASLTRADSAKSITETWTYSYSDASGLRTTTITDPNGHTRTIVSNLTTGIVSSVKDGVGATTSYAYDSFNRLTKITYPEGNYTLYTYDGRGNVVKTVAYPKLGSTSITTTATYGTGADVSTSAAPSTVTTCTYAKTCNKPYATFDGLGNETDYTYDTGTGLMLTMTKPPPTASGVRPVTAFSYSQISTYGVQSAGAGPTKLGSIWKLTQTATCATSAGTVTVSGLTTSLSCGAGTGDEIVSTTSYAGSTNYNALPTAQTTASGDGKLSATTSIAYDSIGNVVAATDPTNVTTNYLYDADRERVATIGPPLTLAGATYSRASYTAYTPDGLASLVEQGTVPGPSGLTASNFTGSFTLLAEQSTAYDGLDRKISDSLIVGGATQNVTQYTYDNANNLTCSAVRRNASIFGSLPTSACTLGTAGSDGPDQITSNTYDADNRLTQVTAGYGTALAATAEAVTYSPNGNVLTAADAKGNLTTSTYDGFDRLSKVQYPTPSNGSVSSSKDYEAFGYDADSHLTSDRRRDGVTITAAFDNLGRTSSISSPSTSYLYDNLGRLTSATRNGQTLTYTNDALGRVTSETGPNGAISAQYDLAGRLTRITWPDPYPNTYFAQYVYDAAGEVTQIQENGATSGAGLLASYSYNALGQRTGVTRGDNVTTTYSYDAALRLAGLAHAFPTTSNNQTITLGYTASNQINSRTSSNATYSWAGTVALSRTYTANGQNQLTQSGTYALSYDGRGNLSSDSVNSYVYDEANNLTNFNNSATLATDALGRLATVTDLSGGVAQSGSRAFRYFGSMLVAEYGTTGSAAGVLEERYVPGPGTDETVVSYPGVGTATKYWLLADERGSLIAQADMNGNVTSTNTYDDYGLPASGNTGRFQYTGQMWVPEAGLYHYKARDYSPTLGRFLQTDPIGYGDGMNWYAYAHNDPVNLIDPSGTQTTCYDQLASLDWVNPSTGQVDQHVGYFTYQKCVEVPDSNSAAAEIVVTARPRPQLQLQTVAAACEDELPYFKCNAQGVLVVTADWQKKSCDTYHKMIASEDRLAGPGTHAAIPLAGASFLGGTLIQKFAGGPLGSLIALISSAIGEIDYLDDQYATPPPGCSK